jgi:hypothetical protein
MLTRGARASARIGVDSAQEIIATEESALRSRRFHPSKKNLLSRVGLSSNEQSAGVTYSHPVPEGQSPDATGAQ